MYLVFTDFSSASLNALGFAANLSKDSGEDILLCHELHDEEELDEDIDMFLSEKRKKKAFEELERISHFANPTHKIIFHYKVFNEMSDADYRKLVKDLQVSIVFTGISSKAAVRKWLFGSRAVDLVELIDCPLMIIPEDTAIKSPKNLLISTTDISLAEARKNTFCRKHFLEEETKTRILYLQQEKKFSIQKQADVIPGETKDHLKCIQKTMKEVQPDLLCVISGPEKDPDGISLSTIQKLALSSQQPLLILPD